ncbi:hypothetical protein [Moorena producens]|uniref:hypothetical protein n=1 Tax=Moorena producens TaxID=1155739 RepID=UPI003C75182A
MRIKRLIENLTISLLPTPYSLLPTPHSTTLLIEGNCHNPLIKQTTTLHYTLST